MSAIIYLYKRMFFNRVRKALKKPITYVFILLGLFYLVLIPYSFHALFSEMKLDSTSGLTAIITVFTFWLIPANMIAYAKRKGLMYRKSDIHFLFPSPVTPKKILLYAHMRTLLNGCLMNLLIAIGAGYIFRVPWWKMVLFFLLSTVIQNFLEGGIMLLLYGSERLTEKSRKLVVKVSYGLVGIFVALGLYTYIVYGLSMESALGFLHSDGVQMVPVIGWYIAVIHLLFMGPATVNVICSILYVLLAAGVLAAAFSMKCTGVYFEDAMKFAEDYEELLANRKQGRTDVKFGKKTKYGKASITYKGGYAKALFYRQMLEYKKSKYFIFDINTVVSLCAGAGIAFLYVKEGGFGWASDFIIPCVMAYIFLVFSGFTGKWGKEIASPYTFLLPDTPFRKLWYATLVQHIQSLINGILFTLPGAIVMKMSPVTAVLCVLFYVCMGACKIYSITVAEALVGNVMGRTAKQLFQMLLYGLTFGVTMLGALGGILMGSIDAAYIFMSLILVGITLGFMTVAAGVFYRMETVE